MGTEFPTAHGLLKPSGSIAQQQPPCTDRQLVRTAAGDLMRTIEPQKGLFQRAIPRIAIRRATIAVAIAERFAPRPGRSVREPLRQPPGHLQLQGVIRGVAQVVQHVDLPPDPDSRR